MCYGCLRPAGSRRRQDENEEGEVEFEFAFLRSATRHIPVLSLALAHCPARRPGEWLPVITAGGAGDADGGGVGDDADADDDWPS